MGPCPWVKMKKREMVQCEVWKIDPVLERIEVRVVGGSKDIGVKVPNKIKFKLNVGDLVEIEHMGVLSKGGLRHPCFIRSLTNPSL